MKKLLFTLLALSASTLTLAAETPLCPLPQSDPKAISTESNSSCAQIIEDAKKEAAEKSLSMVNTTSIPPQLSVGTVYLQAITMMPEGMMRPRNDADIHLEMDVHAKANLPSRGFAPGDWLPNGDIEFTVQKIGDKEPLICDPHTKATTCKLMAMVASDGAHYGDNVRLAGPGFYKVTFNAKSDPHFGWHTDTDSKVLGTEFVEWHFTQAYIMKWTGIGKKGGYG